MKTGNRIVCFVLAAVLLLTAQLPALHTAAAADGEPEAIECVRTDAAAENEKSAGFFDRLADWFRGLLKMLRALVCGGASAQEAGDGVVIEDIYMDKARYLPGEKPVLTVSLRAERDLQAVLAVRAAHLAETVCEGTQTLSLKAGETVLRTARLDLPETDFTGYTVAVTVSENEKTVGAASTAAEVASDWSRFPRYGYLTNYTPQTDAELDAVIDRLNRYHVTGLFFYDVLDRHDRPLAGTPDAPDGSWRTIAGQTASFDTVKGLIDRGHARGMNAYLYNLLFGAYQDYAGHGVDAAWGLYRDPAGTQQDYHGELPASWETQRIYLFNPADKGWQDHYLAAAKDALDVFGYDGLQTDSLGGRGTVYDAQGNEVDLSAAYVPLLNRLGGELGARVIFNPVSGYGSEETLAGTDYDIVYEEFWPSDGRSYNDLKNEVYRLREKAADDKGIVLAAYMDRNSGAAEFNPAGILLTDAVLMASGAAHLELGDTGMLKSEYYPGDTLAVSGELEKALQRYYSFSVSYENILRDASFRPTGKKTLANMKNVSEKPEKNGVWCIGKENDKGEMTLNFINLTGLDDLSWPDENGTQATPQTKKRLPVRQYVSEYPSRVYLASPDRADAGMEELPFVTGFDFGGKYVSFVLPELAIWDCVYLAA